MVLVFEGLATLGAFELAVAGRLVEQLVLPDRQKERRRRKKKVSENKTDITKRKKKMNSLDKHSRKGKGRIGRGGAEFTK